MRCASMALVCLLALTAGCFQVVRTPAAKPVAPVAKPAPAPNDNGAPAAKDNDVPPIQDNAK